ncbi:hypothetical protein Y027_4566 [Burkholderia pseudomallei TSV5]|nr:hypothetical protein X948_4536 [Burkholderia pseudomallei MSHR5608]KGX53478.1 hypothetical protein Y027_4566 [Burkholderia pseudomallei TSV5]
MPDLCNAMVSRCTPGNHPNKQRICLTYLIVRQIMSAILTK